MGGWGKEEEVVYLGGYLPFLSGSASFSGLLPFFPGISTEKATRRPARDCVCYLCSLSKCYTLFYAEVIAFLFIDIGNHFTLNISYKLKD